MILLPSERKRDEPDRRVWFIHAALILGVLFAFWKVAGNDFINYDDGTYVTENPIVQSGVTLRGVAWALSTGYGSNWHPLTWLSHMVDCGWYGLNPRGHHLTSLVFHGLNTLLLFMLLRRLTGALWRSALVAALFAWHPLHVESVAWVAERKDVLSTFCGLLTLLAYVKYVQQPGRKRYYALMVMCFALGLMSKPMLVTLPFVLLLLDYWPLQRISGEAGAAKVQLRRLVLEKTPLFILALGSCVVTFLVQRKGGAMMPVENLSVAHRVVNAVEACAVYLRKMIWPADLAIFYPLPKTWPVAPMIVAVLALGLISAAAFLWRRQRPYLLVGWLWYLGMLVPVLGLVQVGSQAMADRYTYLPLVGVFIMLAWGAAEWVARAPAQKSMLAWAVAVPMLAACLLVTRMQTGYWRDSEKLFRRSLELTADNVTARVNLGSALNQTNQLDEAQEQFLAALRMNPNSGVALNGLAANYTRRGDLANAVKYLKECVAKEPYYGDAHYNLANALVKQGNYAEAAEHYAAALRIRPEVVDARNNYGAVLMQLGHPAEAAEQFQQVLLLKPDDPVAHAQYGGAFLKLGRLNTAAVQYAEAVRLKPDYAHARFRLGLIQLQQEEFDSAIANFRETVRLEPANGEAWYNLGCADAAVNQLPDAAVAFSNAIALKPDDPDFRSRFAAVLARQGKLDEAIQAYHEALKLKPDDAETHGRLAAVLAVKGDAEAAARWYREAIRLKPDWPVALRDLAWILATNPNAALRDGPEAVRLAERARDLLKQPDPRILNALDAAYAETGRYDDAIRTATQVRQLAVSAGQTNLVAQTDRRLEQYRAGKPWRE